MKLLHTMIRIKNIDESLKFYTELLNMKFDKKKELDDCELYFLTDEDGCNQIELTYNHDTPQNGYDIGTGFGHLAFSVKSLDDFSKKLYAMGYKYLYEPYKLNGISSTIAFINDPDGYEIELIEKVI